MLWRYVEGSGTRDTDINTRSSTTHDRTTVGTHSYRYDFKGGYHHGSTYVPPVQLPTQFLLYGSKRFRNGFVPYLRICQGYVKIDGYGQTVLSSLQSCQSYNSEIEPQPKRPLWRDCFAFQEYYGDFNSFVVICYSLLQDCQIVCGMSGRYLP